MPASPSWLPTASARACGSLPALHCHTGGLLQSAVHYVCSRARYVSIVSGFCASRSISERASPPMCQVVADAGGYVIRGHAHELIVSTEQVEAPCLLVTQWASEAA